MNLDRTVLFGEVSREPTLVANGEAVEAANGSDNGSTNGSTHFSTVLVLGLGESGFAMARWCARHGCVLRLADSRATPPNLAQALALPSASSTLPHTFVSGADDAFPVAALDDGVDVIAISPGLSPLDPAVAALLASAQARGIPVWGELEFFSRALKALAALGHASQVIAITGTNGKTTTTALTGQLVARAGRSVAVAGNISPSMLDRLSEALDASDLPQVWVLELSSFQLETALSFSPDTAAVLNVTQDHLDWHGGFAGYAAAKFRIFGDRPALTRAVLNRTDASCTQWLADHPQFSAVSFGIDAPQKAGDFGIYVENGLQWLAQAVDVEADEAAATAQAMANASRDMAFAAAAASASASASSTDAGLAEAVADAKAEVAASRRTFRPRKRANSGEANPLVIKPLMPVNALRIQGLHNAGNALAALALCRAIGLPLAPLLHGLRDYRGEPHRVETLASLNGVDFVDDSKATNVGATVAALDGLARPVWLIAGGVGKDQDFSPLADAVSRWCKTVMLIGRDAPLLRAALADAGVPLLDQPSLEAATTAAAQLAQSGDAVLLSPACASFDMFRNYAHRADVFRQCVEALAAEQGVTI